MAEDAQREWNAAAEREESKNDDGTQGENEVLSDDRPRPLAESKGGEEVLEPIVHQDDIGLFEGGIGTAGAHGDADVSGGESGCIIDSVADHGDPTAGLGEGDDSRDFFVGFEFGSDFVEVELTLEMLTGGLSIPGERHAMETRGAEAGDHVAGLRADVVAKEEPSQERAVGHPDLRHAGRRGSYGGGELAAFRRIDDEFATTEGGGLSVHLGAEPEAGE